jgi:hypothetical protein
VIDRYDVSGSGDSNEGVRMGEVVVVVSEVGKK